VRLAVLARNLHAAPNVATDDAGAGGFANKAYARYVRALVGAKQPAR